MSIKVGACDFSIPGYKAGTMKFAKDVGLDGVQIGFFEEGKGYPLTQNWMRDYYLEEADKYGIEIPSLCVGEYDFCRAIHRRNTDKGQKAWQTIDLALETAIYMNIKTVMVPSYMDGICKTKEDFLHTYQVLQYACKVAVKHGMTISSENPFTIKQNLEMIEEVGCSNLKVLYDSQNYWLNFGWSQTEILQGLIDNDLIYDEVHVKDGIGNAEGVALLGHGDSDFDGSVALLKRAGFSGWVHIENFYDKAPLRYQHQNQLEAMKMDVETIRIAFA